MSHSGHEYTLESHGYRAVITQAGATLRELQFEGRDLIVGFPEGAMASAGRGQHLIPWPNRIRDGKYEYSDRSHQLPLSEPARANASHGLTRWACWHATEHTAHTVVMGYQLMAQPGYPWAISLQIRYSVGASGLSVVVEATNLSDSPAPYAYGAHPYLTTGSETIDDDTLLVSTSAFVEVDPDRLLPTRTTAVAGTALDFAAGKALRGIALDTAFATQGPLDLTLTNSAGHGVKLWGDQAIKWVQFYTADDNPAMARHALAAEPMTSPPDAFNSKVDLIHLAPGSAHTLAWGITAI